MPQIVAPGSALGEAVGKLIERDIFNVVGKIAKSHGFTVSSETLRNKGGSEHSIDIVVKDQKGEPVVLVEPKYLRYTKHNWDKGSRLVVGHTRLRQRYGSIRKSIAVLAGRWTSTSKTFIKGAGIEIHEIPFEHIVSVLSKRRIAFDWDEKDDVAPMIAWTAFSALPQNTLKALGKELTESVRGEIVRSVRRVLLGPGVIAGEIAEVEITVKTKQEEFIVKSFPNVTEAIRYLLEYQIDISQIKVERR